MLAAKLVWLQVITRYEQNATQLIIKGEVSAIIWLHIHHQIDIIIITKTKSPHIPAKESESYGHIYLTESRTCQVITCWQN